MNKLIVILLLVILLLLCILNIKKEYFQNKNNKIPKIIYKSGKESKHDLSPDVNKLFEKTLKNNPNFELKYYSDKDCETFLKKNFDDEVVKAYNKLKPGSYKADLFRYCILYKNGGIWSDLTDDFLVPIEEIIDFKNDSIVLAEDKKYKGFEGIQIGFMASYPNNPLFLKAINKIKYNVNNNIYGKTNLSVTGPNMFYDILKKESPKINIIFDGNGTTGCYLDKKTNKKLIKYKSLNNLNKILKRNDKQYYARLWDNKDIYN